MKRILSIFLSLVLTAALLCPAAAAANETDGKDSDWLYITLDPGHGGNGAGGNDPGAISSTYGYHEADLVLKIGLYLKQELETYRNVHVDMTRSDSYGTSATAPLSKVENRVLFAAGQHSDLLVSLHLNSSPSQSARGAEVLVSNGNYRPEIAKVLDGVGTNILMQLKNLGIYNRGLVKKSSQDHTLYPNGKLADYYGIVRYGVENNVPSMIVEHCFISSNSECEQFLSSDAKLRAIAQADARGIAAYYGLQKKAPGEVDVEPTFYDCRHHWAKTSIEAAASAGWVNGVSAGEFQPNGTLTRAAFVTMLGRMAGVKDTDYTTSVFRDVPDGEWYTSFVAWATENGIVDGYGDGIFLPQNNMDEARKQNCTDDVNREDASLNSIVPSDPNVPYDMKEIIERVVDGGYFFEVMQNFAKNIIIGFARMGGRSVGIVANQPAYLAGVLDIDASDKASRFIRFCDCFNIPLITFEDVPGFLPGYTQENNGIIRHGAKIVYAFAEATVPKLTVITRKAYGGAYIVMNSKQTGADVNFAYPSAEIAVMGAEGAVNILFRKADAETKAQELNAYKEKFATPYQAAELGFIDEIILPKQTRKRLIQALEMTENKMQTNPPKKHGNMPL